MTGDPTFDAVETSPEAARSRRRYIDDVMRAVAAYARAHATPSTEAELAELWRHPAPVAFHLETVERQARAAIVVTLPELRVVSAACGLVPVGLVLEVPVREPPPELPCSD